ncbi:MAG: amidohydrolase [Coriobacteriia bacterium]|nr:amidohydrolase [Coriobacteriia bacterium]
MLFSNIDYLTSDFQVARGFVGVIDDRIAYVGTEEPANPAIYGERYTGNGRLLMPGIYNTHAHAPMVLLRGYAEAMNLQDWLFQKIFPFEALMDANDNYIGSQLAIAEMLRFGVVSYSDMYFHSSNRIQAVIETGIKANICPGLMVFDPDTRYEDLSEMAENAQLTKEFHGAENGRLRIDLNIHSEYISNPQVISSVVAQATELGIGIQVHISETKAEHEECKERRGGLTPTAYMESLGMFNVPVTAAHCVWIEPNDWQILANHGVSVSVNPASNLKLASGFTPIGEMLAAGVNLTLGTDGCASNNNHNMFKDLYLLATVYKAATADPMLITPSEDLRIATVNGAMAQSRTDCGTIAEGMKADLVVLDTNVPWMQPVSSMVNNIVYAAEGSDVVMTMVDGKVLYRNGEWTTIDIEQVMYNAQQATDRINAAVAAG